MDLISVIVPVYKVDQYLNRCVESIVNQTYKNLEIILVDDGSPDQCSNMCDEWAEKDSRIRVIHKENGGLSDARNAGMNITKGDYISFIDSDDWIQPAFYENLLQTMVTFGCDIVGCQYHKCSGNELGEVEREYSVVQYEQKDAMSALIDNSIQQVVWNKLYTKSVISDVFFEIGKYHEDEFWSYQVLARAKKYAAISYCGYNYFQRTDSIMGESYSLKRLDAVEAKKRRQNYLEQWMQEVAPEGWINMVYTCLYHGQLAIRELPREERKRAISYLKETVKSNKYKASDLDRLTLTHRIWFRMATVSFAFTCRIRNLLKVGI